MHEAVSTRGTTRKFFAYSTPGPTKAQKNFSRFLLFIAFQLLAFSSFDCDSSSSRGSEIVIFIIHSNYSQTSSVVRESKRGGIMDLIGGRIPITSTSILMVNCDTFRIIKSNLFPSATLLLGDCVRLKTLSRKLLKANKSVTQFRGKMSVGRWAESRSE